MGVVGIAPDTEEKATRLKGFVAEATRELASRLVAMIDEILDRSPRDRLNVVVNDAQWADFRLFVAHLLMQVENIKRLQDQTEQLLRNTFGYSLMRGDNDPRSRSI